MIKKFKIPTLIGFLVLILGLATGVILVKGDQFLGLKASPQISPKSVEFSNISDNSLAVSWVTDQKTVGFIKYGKSADLLNQTATLKIQQASVTHFIEIKSLTPSTTYFFNINSDEKDFDNNGLPWQAKTGPVLAANEKTMLISGSVLTATGAPAKNVIVDVVVGGGSPLVATTTEEGNFLLPISNARTLDLTSRVTIDLKTTLIEISANAGPDGISSAQAFVQSARNLPPLILGQTHDFKNLPPAESGEIPQANLNVPENPASPSSGFQIDKGSPLPSSAGSKVTLDSVKENEVVTTQSPEFFGEGPVNTVLTITVESELMTDQVTVPKTGEWKWNPPQNLSAGIHKITLTWKDASGITRTLTRNFIVQASEGPAFEATPSATPSQTPKITATPTVRALSSATPTSFASATPTLRASSTPTASEEATPQPTPPASGSLTPTILLTIMGIGVLAFALMLWQGAAKIN